VGQLGGRRDAVAEHRVGQEGAVLVVHRLLEHRLGDALRDAAVHLPVDDHRVDHGAAVVDRDVAQDLRRAGLGVHLDDADVRPRREREVRRIPDRCRLERRLETFGQRVRRPGGERELRDRLRLLRCALDAERTVAPFEIRVRDLELVRRDQPRLRQDLLRRVPERNAADRQRAAAVRVHPERRDRGVAVQHVDVVERNTELVGGDLRPRRDVALPCGEVPVTTVTFPVG
jgi:hypothetical protein